QRPVRPTNEFRPILPPRLKANKALLFPFTGTSMIRKFGRAIIILALLNGAPAYAFTNPLSSLQVASFNLLERGPLADFLDVFREQAIPRRVVAWRRGQGPGTVVISTTERRLYYVLKGGRAIQYGVGVGRQGFAWSGTKAVSMKREWPDWTPPPE